MYVGSGVPDPLAAVTASLVGCGDAVSSDSTPGLRDGSIVGRATPAGEPLGEACADGVAVPVASPVAVPDALSRKGELVTAGVPLLLGVGLEVPVAVSLLLGLGGIRELLPVALAVGLADGLRLALAAALSEALGDGSTSGEDDASGVALPEGLSGCATGVSDSSGSTSKIAVDEEDGVADGDAPLDSEEVGVALVLAVCDLLALSLRVADAVAVPLWLRLTVAALECEPPGVLVAVSVAEPVSVPDAVRVAVPLAVPLALCVCVSVTVPLAVKVAVPVAVCV